MNFQDLTAGSKNLQVVSRSIYPVSVSYSGIILLISSIES